MTKNVYDTNKQLYVVLKPLFLLFILLFSFSQATLAQKKMKVLLIGNSFTAANDLAGLLRNVTMSAGDSIDVGAFAPGGYTLEMHSTDPSTLFNLSLGDWNYVVLQEQSQLPALSDADVDSDVFPYAKKMDSLVHATNKCGRSVFFQTWGYRDGDLDNCPFFPPVCTFKGMDSMLALRYNQMAIDNFALLAPVGRVFKELRAVKPTLDLYDADGRHPSAAGSYAAAVTLYTILFGKDPKKIVFNFSVLPPDADLIRQTVFTHVYSTLPTFYVGKFNPKANFSSSVAANIVTFNSTTSDNAVNYNWSFGDGNTSILENPVHTYAASGTYNVKLVVDDCLKKDSITNSVTVTVTSIKESALLASIDIYPNPATTFLNFKSNLNLANVKVNVWSAVGANMFEDVPLEYNTLNISHLASGLYFLKMKDENTGATMTKKFIKE